MSRRRFTRRDLFKVAPLAGATAVGVGLALGGRDGSAERSTHGTCRFCLMHCGIVAKTKGDRLLRVEGDLGSRTRGFLCLHGHALREVVHSDGRVKAPLLRRGDRFVEVGWNEALGFVADRLQRIRRQWGPEAFVVQTGWPLVRHPLVGLLHRFCRAFGTPNLATVASLCEASGRMGQALTTGSKYAADVRGAKTLVLWGANPTHSAPPFAHVVEHKAATGNLIVIDPVRTALAKAATQWLCVKPGTDGALALSLMHVLIAEGLYDQAFVAEHTRGFEELKQLVAGYAPGQTAAVTSVSAEQVTKAARLMAADRPTGVWFGLGIEHHRSGVQTVRAVSSLEALLGTFDEGWGQRQLTAPGPHFADEPLPALYRLTTPEPVPPPVKARPLGYDEYPLFEVYNREAQGNLIARAVLDDQPYPVRALMLVASNALVTVPDAAAMARAAQKLELLVTVDCFMSASALQSHVVLPASTFAEAPDVDDAGTEVARSGLVSLQHQSWPDWKVVFELGKALGLGQYFPWGSFKEALDAPQVPYLRDDAHQPRPAATAVAGTRFGTPSGKVELVSSLLQGFGLGSGLPEWTPPLESPDAEYPLVLVSGPRTRAYINSQFHGIPTVEAKQREPEVLVHPDAAAEARVHDGSMVALVSPHGRVVLRLKVTADVHPQAAVAPAGWARSNLNLLTEAQGLDPISGFPAFRSGKCRIERV